MKTKDRIVVFNHAYVLQHDLKRTFIYSRKNLPKIKTVNVLVSTPWFTQIHPLYAMMFSLASEPIALSDFVFKVASFFEISEEKAKQLILPFLDRTDPFYSHFDGVTSQFPKQVLIDVEKAIFPAELYSPQMFAFESLDFQTERALYAPRTVVFMPNSTCTTQCVYCYADRSHLSAKMDFQKVRSILEECRKLRVMSFSITGGDIFVYPHWRDLLACMKDNGFAIGLLSTKTPLRREDVILLRQYDVNLQFSLDSVDPKVLKAMVGMDSSYLERVRQTFTYCEEEGLFFKAATVLTNLNSDLANIDALYTFLKTFSVCNLWEIRLANRSLYSRKNFDELRLDQKEVARIDEQIKTLQASSKIEISWSANNNKYYFEGKEGSRSFKGARCSANYSNMMILPDGKVTICEQLYWNPRYIIGDLMEQTIPEVWSSERALVLAYPRKECFRDVSPCKTCSLFDACYAYPNRCIVDVLKGYGEENEDFPDPRCEKAPALLRELCHV